MFIVIKPSLQRAETLIVNRQIFNRPTPWRVFFRICAHLPFNGKYSPFRCVLLPDDVARNLLAYEFWREDDMLSYCAKGSDAIQTTQILPFLNRLFAIGVYESFFVLGTNYRPWEWRWNPGTFNKKELLHLLLQTPEYREHVEKLHALQRDLHAAMEQLPS